MRQLLKHILIIYLLTIYSRGTFLFCPFLNKKTKIYPPHFLVPYCKDKSGHFGATKSVQVRIGTGQNRCWAKSAQNKNEPTWLNSALIKKNSCAKLIVLRVMVTRYIGNMIVFLCCHYAHLSITITSKLSALNHNRILYYCNCHATISSSVHMFAIFFRKL